MCMLTCRDVNVKDCDWSVKNICWIQPLFQWQQFFKIGAWSFENGGFLVETFKWTNYCGKFTLNGLKF